jgi:RND family efflux transporter MFP subunit
VHKPLLILLAALALPIAAPAAPLQPVDVTEWKAVYGRIESRNRIPARARLGGTLVTLAVSEGDSVTAGQVLAQVVDEKLAFQLSATDARLDSLNAQLDNARAELKRGEELQSRGVTTVQRLDALRTQVDVLSGQIEATRADRRVIEQQAAEGAVLAPIAGRVLSVPSATGAVVMPGEEIASVGGGGIFLRLAVPERHATGLKEGAEIQIEQGDTAETGKLAKIYPLIENGRVLADVDVQGLSDRFYDARVLVRLPVGHRKALLVPAQTVKTHAGLDAVALNTPQGPLMRTVVPGPKYVIDGQDMVEILSGLQAGDDLAEQK